MAFVVGDCDASQASEVNSQYAKLKSREKSSDWSNIFRVSAHLQLQYYEALIPVSLRFQISTAGMLTCSPTTLWAHRMLMSEGRPAWMCLSAHTELKILIHLTRSAARNIVPYKHPIICATDTANCALNSSPDALVPNTTGATSNQVDTRMGWSVWAKR